MNISKHWTFLSFFLLSIVLICGCSDSRNEEFSDERTSDDYFETLFDEIVDGVKTVQDQIISFRDEMDTLWVTEQETLRTKDDISQVITNSAFQELKEKCSSFENDLQTEKAIKDFADEQLAALAGSLDEDNIEYDSFEEIFQKLNELTSMLNDTLQVIETKKEKGSDFLETNEENANAQQKDIADKLETLKRKSDQFDLEESEPEIYDTYFSRAKTICSSAENDFDQIKEKYEVARKNLADDQEQRNSYAEDIKELLKKAEDSRTKAEEKKKELEANNSHEKLTGFFDTAKQVILKEPSTYDSDNSFRGSFISVPWSDFEFSDLTDYCKIADKEVRVEYFPFMDTFSIGTCNLPECTVGADGSWIYNFEWKTSGGDPQNLLTITISETGISAEQKECRSNLSDPDKNLEVLNLLRLGELRFSIVSKGEKKGSKKSRLSESAFLYGVQLKEDKFEAGDQDVSIEQKLKDLGILTELKTAAEAELRVEYIRNSPLFEVTYEKGNIQLARNDSELYGIPLLHKAIFLTIPSENNSDDRIVRSITLIADVPTRTFVETTFQASGAIEQVEAQAAELEMQISALQAQGMVTSDARSDDPKIAQRIFRENQSIIKHNRILDSKINKLDTKIKRLYKSLDVKLKKQQRIGDKYFRNNYFVHYKIYFRNMATDEEFLFIDASGGSDKDDTWFSPTSDKDADSGANDEPDDSDEEDEEDER